MHRGQRASTAELKQHILDELAAIWNRNPTLRLGQLIGNLFETPHPALYNIEDADLLHGLEYLYPEVRHDTETDPL